MASSEHSLDNDPEALAAEALVTETEEAPEEFNCKGAPHLYNSLEHRDYHKVEKDTF